MSEWQKLVIFSSIPQLNLDLSNDRKVSISRTKYEDLLRPFSIIDSLSSRFVRKISESDALRTLLFLGGLKETQLSDSYPIKQTLPFVLNPMYDLGKLLETAYKEKAENATKKSGDVRKLFLESYQAQGFEVLSTALSKQETVRAISRSRAPEERKKALERAFSNNREEISAAIASMIETMARLLPEMTQLTSIADSVFNYPLGVVNSEILNTTVKLPDAHPALFAEIEKLASIDAVLVGIESFCLDCHFVHSKAPYRSSQSNIRMLNLPTLCPNCRGEGVLHKLEVQYPIGLHQFITPQTNWLQEVIIGLTVAHVRSVKKVFVHKMLHQIHETGFTKGVEADVIIITNDDRMILLEVTTQTDADNILREFIKKRDNLQQVGIEYDGLAYITACPTFQGYHTIDEKSRVFGAHHLGQLNLFLEKEFKL